MKFSESWLREWVNPEVATEELVEQLTMAGLEVDAVEPVAGEFSGVVVGEILSAEQHPDADKLRVCQVAGGPDGAVQVVCGAPNARPGIKIPFALVGAVLPGNFKLKKPNYAVLSPLECFVRKQSFKLVMTMMGSGSYRNRPLLDKTCVNTSV